MINCLSTPLRAQRKHLLHKVGFCSDGKRRCHFRRRTEEEDVRAFWGRVDKRCPNECWFWTGSSATDNHGKRTYGRLRFRGKNWLSHRVAYTLAKEDIAAGLVIRHTCDEKPCCNPTHLLIGTPADNMLDAVERGRMAKGDRSGHRTHPEAFPAGEKTKAAKITDEQVRVMRTEYDSGKTSGEIAFKLSISITQVNRIIKGKSRSVTTPNTDVDLARNKTLHRKNNGIAHRKLNTAGQLEELLRLRTDGWTWAKLAEHFGHSLTAVRNAFIRATPSANYQRRMPGNRSRPWLHSALGFEC